MSGCILRISGSSFKPEDSLSKAKLTAITTWRKGDERISGNCCAGYHTDCGASVLVSDNATGDLEIQVTEAIEFLNENKDKIQSVMKAPSVDSAYLDFGVFCGADGMAHFDRFPLPLIQLCAEIGLTIEISHYMKSD